MFNQTKKVFKSFKQAMFNPEVSPEKKLMDIFLAVTETTDKTSSAPDAQLNALSQRQTVSQLLFYRYAEEIECSDGQFRTIYTMDDGRKGFIVEVEPPTFLSDENERDMHSFFNSLDVEPNLIVHINTFASRNIEANIRYYESLHHMENVNIRRRDMLKELIAHRGEALRSWTKEPMGKNGVKARNLVNTISVLFEEETEIDNIIDVYVNTENILVSYGVKDFKPSKLISTVSEFLKPEDLITDEFEDIHQQLNHQMTTGSSIKLNNKNGNFKLGNNWEAATLTTERFPKSLSAFEFQSAFFDPFGKDFKMALPNPFVCSLVISFEGVEKTKRKVLDKAKWNIGQINRMADTLEKKNPVLADKKEENENISHYIQKSNEYPLKAQWSLTIYDNNEKDLKKHCTLIKKKFKEMSNDESGGWILKEESYSPIAYQSFLMGLPLQYSQIVTDNLKRMKVLFKSNNAQIAPLISGSNGIGKPIMYLPGRTGHMIPLDFFASTKNQNIVVIGPPGAGKSFLMNEIFVNYLSCGTLVRLVDIGDSYKDTTNRLGGKFVEASEDIPLCLNFFSKISTAIVEIEDETIETVHPDELTTIVPIIGNMLKMNLRSSFSENSLSSDDASRKAMVTILEQAIGVAYARQGKAAGMQTIWEYLIELREESRNSGNEPIVKLLNIAIVGLQDYVIYTDGKGKKFKGKNYEFFNGVNNLDFDRDLFTFEMEKLTKKGEDIVEIVSMTVMHQIATEAYFIKGRNKLVGFDEVARLLKKPMFVDFMDDFSRRIRKYGGMLILLTQYISDYFHSDNAKILFEGASFKIYMEQEEESIDEAADSGKVSLNDGQVALMKSVKARTPYYNEFMLNYSGSSTVILNKVDLFSYWLYTTNSDDKKLIYDMETKHELLEGEGAWMMALIKTGKSEDEALKEIIKKRKAGLV